MARLRQQNAQSYGSGANINAEFENIIRYLNSAELGNRTLGELLRILFSEEGTFRGPVALRFDAANGLEYRIGEYPRPDEGWLPLASAEDLRGRPGSDLGLIEQPIFSDRVDVVSGAGDTIFDYAMSPDETYLVFLNGALQVEGSDYDVDPAGGSAGAGAIEFQSGLSLNDLVTVYRVRAASTSGYTRQDFQLIADQQVFSFPHADGDGLQVYVNGILQREGATADYVSSPGLGIVTMTTPIPLGSVVTMILADNSAVRRVSGLMLGEDFLSPTSGGIRYDRLDVPDDAIPQQKVDGLAAMIAARRPTYIGPTTPVAPQTGDLWLDTAQAPNQLKFWDGVQWLRTSPETSLPTFAPAQAGLYVRLNSTGTAFEYAALDLSGVVPLTQKGATGGIASLDPTGRIPMAQLPQFIARQSIHTRVTTPGNGPVRMTRVFRQRLRLNGIAVATNTGSCLVRVAIDGVGVGPTYTANSVGADDAIEIPIDVDASVNSREIGFIVSSNSSANQLDVTLAAQQFTD